MDGKTCARLTKTRSPGCGVQARSTIQLAAALSQNRDRLVAPSIDPAYGQEAACLDTIPPWRQRLDVKRLPVVTVDPDADPAQQDELAQPRVRYARHDASLYTLPPSTASSPARQPA